jgi:hypothetical protein
LGAGVNRKTIKVAGVTRSRTNMCNFQGNSLGAVVLSDDPTSRKFGAENNL